MTTTYRNHHRSVRRIIAVVAGGSVALGAYTFGVSTSPGSIRGAGISTSPGRSAAAPTVSRCDSSRCDVRPWTTSHAMAPQRKAGQGQQDF